jgi:hypothetical protein
MIERVVLDREERNVFGTFVPTWIANEILPQSQRSELGFELVEAGF